MTHPIGSRGSAGSVAAAAHDGAVAKDGSGNNSGSVPFASLALAEDATAVRAAIDRVIASGWYVLGPVV
jgi:hypothetical protein